MSNYTNQSFYNTELVFMLKQKESSEKKMLEKKLLLEGNFLKELSKNNEKIPMEVAFALLSAGASIPETKKVAEEWMKQQNEKKQQNESEDPYLLCLQSPYNATPKEKAFLTPSLYKPLLLPSKEETLRSTENMMNMWKRHDNGWKWNEEYNKLSQDEKDALEEAERKRIEAFFDKETADYPKNEAAHFAAYLKSVEKRRNSALSAMARKLNKDASKKLSGECLQSSVPVKVFEDLCKQIAQKAAMPTV